MVLRPVGVGKGGQCPRWVDTRRTNSPVLTSWPARATKALAQGSRNKISKAFLDALAADFEEHGEGVIRICRLERPLEYLRIVAALMPAL
jgi:hypothetical protein